MQRLGDSGAVRPLCGSLGVKGLIEFKFQNVRDILRKRLKYRGFLFVTNTLSYSDTLAPGLIHNLCCTHFNDVSTFSF